MLTESELLAHYLERGGGAVERLARGGVARLRAARVGPPAAAGRWPVMVCNIGIGVGLFDDWLGHELGAAITSVDRDP